MVSDYYRNPHREEDESALSDYKSSPNLIEDKVQQNQEFKKIHQIISTFSEQHQEIIALKYGAGLTNRKIASITGLTETNVGTILSRLVRKIRKELGVDHE